MNMGLESVDYALSSEDLSGCVIPLGVGSLRHRIEKDPRQ